eukprot:CAMPEP_0117566836 /NCGR_PEP_ID=MMETSP0784-20121206/57296_1 /TAXON_ID=39447 /ORGANISM="" /LENGTH=47 /DNA_ID= /DNA_START= /DNA_END= /DNA_ORIENTATION=
MVDPGNVEDESSMDISQIDNLCIDVRASRFRHLGHYHSSWRTPSDHG